MTIMAVTGSPMFVCRNPSPCDCWAGSFSRWSLQRGYCKWVHLKDQSLRRRYNSYRTAFFKPGYEIVGGNFQGVSDVEFIGHNLYALLAGAGCSQGAIGTQWRYQKYMTMVPGQWFAIISEWLMEDKCCRLTGFTVPNHLPAAARRIERKRTII